MRVAMVSEHASPLAVTGGVDAGGQNVHVAALAARLSRQGHDVLVFTRRDSERLPWRVRTPDGYTVVNVPVGPPAALPKDDLAPLMPSFGRYVGETLASSPADVLHAHFWMSASAALVARRMTGTPVAVTFHALGVVKQRYQPDTDTSPKDRIRTEAFISASADHIIATSDEEVDELQRLGMPMHRSTVIPCGVDQHQFNPRGPSLVKSRFRRAVVISRLVPRKGIDDAIRALTLAPGVELLIAGGPVRSELPSDPEAQRLICIAEREGVLPRVHLLGRVERHEIPALIRSADAVIATPWYEPFGIVALEAMACGVPVIASRVGGLADTVVDGVTGLHVPVRDPGAIAEALALLTSQPELAVTMGRESIRRVRQSYTWDLVARQTASVYAAMLAGNHSLASVADL